MISDYNSCISSGAESEGEGKSLVHKVPATRKRNITPQKDQQSTKAHRKVSPEIGKSNKEVENTKLNHHE